MPGGKKFRLVHRKNWAKKKQLRNISIPLELVTILPVRVNLNLITPSLDKLKLELRHNLPSGWLLLDTTPAQLVVAKSVFMASICISTTTFSLVVEESFQWKVMLPQGIALPHSSHFVQSQPLTITHADGILNILHILDSATICVGNSDAKFRELKEWKCGKFVGLSMSITMFSIVATPILGITLS